MPEYQNKKQHAACAAGGIVGVCRGTAFRVMGYGAAVRWRREEMPAAGCISASAPLHP